PVLEQGAGAEAAGDDQQVDRRRVGEAVAGQDDEAADGGDGSLLGRHGEDAEGRALLRAPRLDPRHPPGDRQHLERPGEVEHLDAVEDEDGGRQPDGGGGGLHGRSLTWKPPARGPRRGARALGWSAQGLRSWRALRYTLLGPRSAASGARAMKIHGRLT